MSDINNDNKDKNSENNSDDELKNKQDINSDDLNSEKNDINENKNEIKNSDENDKLGDKDEIKKEIKVENEEIDDSENSEKNEKEEIQKEILASTETEPIPEDPLPEKKPAEQIKPDSKYQISLIDEENLKIKVLLDSPITIDCTAKGNLTDSGFQTNKIILTPEGNTEYKEIEVSITLESELPKSEIVSTKKRDTNYKVNLLNDSTLKIVLNTEKKLTIDCNYKDIELNDSNFNKITINPLKDKKKQEVEILLTVQEKTESKADIFFEPGKLIPNPEVAELLATSDAEIIPMTPEEKLNDLLYKNNPFVAQRKLLQNNLMRGAIAANILFVIAIFGFYAWGSQTETIPDAKEQRRLIVLQDLPDPKINLENVEDPMKKPEEETEENSENPNVVIRKVTPRRFNRPPVVNNNLITRNNDTTKTRDTTDFSNELDSLTKNPGITSDSTAGQDSSITNNLIPDSLKTDFSENEVGLKIGTLPKSWKVIDSSKIVESN